MLKLSAITAYVREITVEMPVFDVSIVVKYYPGKFTPAYEAKVEGMLKKAIAGTSLPTPEELESMTEEEVAERIGAEAEQNVGATNFAVQMLKELLHSTDITDDDGIPLKMTEENLAQIPYPLLYTMFSEIKEDMSPKKKNSVS